MLRASISVLAIRLSSVLTAAEMAPGVSGVGVGALEASGRWSAITFWPGWPTPLEAFDPSVPPTEFRAAFA